MEQCSASGLEASLNEEMRMAPALPPCRNQTPRLARNARILQPTARVG